MKYIIKNCPAFTEEDNRYGLCFDDYNGYCKPCKDITDCLLKRIVDVCREQNLKYDTTACSVLELLEIEECENE